MNASLRRKLEAIEQTLDKMIDRSQNGIPIIVEGRNDKEALRVLKVPGKIICLKASTNSFYDFTESIAHNREVTILTDFDREGTRLVAKLVHELTHMRVKVDFTIWKKLKALCRSDIRTVEELASYVERLRTDLGQD